MTEPSSEPSTSNKPRADPTNTFRAIVSQRFSPRPPNSIFHQSCRANDTQHVVHSFTCTSSMQITFFAFHIDFIEPHLVECLVQLHFMPPINTQRSKHVFKHLSKHKPCIFFFCPCSLPDWQSKLCRRLSSRRLNTYKIYPWRLVLSELERNV